MDRTCKASFPRHAGRPVVSGQLLLRAFLLALFAILVLPVGASAGTVTSWSGIQPTGNVGTGVPVSIQGRSVPPSPSLLTSTARMYVDGVSIPVGSGLGKFQVVVITYATYQTVSFTHSQQPAWADGPHTIRVEIADSAGAPSSYQWSATVMQPPTPSWVEPSADSTTYSGLPTILMSLSDNTPGTTFDVIGAIHTGSATGPVVASFAGLDRPSGLSAFSPSNELSPGTYYVTASVTDAAGNTAALNGASALRFSTAAASAMSVMPSCGRCHTMSRHPLETTCTRCHPGYDEGHSGGDPCDSCHPVGHWEGATPCTRCHGPAFPTLRQHTAANVAPRHQGSCSGCHVTSLIEQHRVTPTGSVYPNQCDTCHTSADTGVQAAITSGSTTCVSCHVDHNAAHDTVVTPTCAECHGGDPTVIHGMCSTCHPGGSGAAPAGATCTTCHPAMSENHGAGPFYLARLTPGEENNEHFSEYLSWGYAKAQDGANNTGTPHGGYTTTTNKCAVCHAVHRAPASGTVLTAISGASFTPLTYTKGCAFCHALGGGGFSVVQVVMGTDGTISPHSECARCHVESPHGVGASIFPVLAQRLLNRGADDQISHDIDAGVNDISISTFDADSERGLTLGTGYLCNNCHYRSAVMAKKLVFPVNSVDAVPAVGTVGDDDNHKYTGHRVTAVATDDWNRGTGADASDAIDAYYTGGGAVGAQSRVAFAPSDSCQTCHDALDAAGDSAFPHGYVDAVGGYATAGEAGASLVWLTTAGRLGSGKTLLGTPSGGTTPENQNEVNMLLTEDGLCLKCHVDGDGSAGVGVTF